MAKKKKKEKRNTKKIFLIVVAAIVVIILLATYGVPPPRYIPKELVGTWRTTSTAYADRFIELSPATVSFGTGAANISTTGFMNEVIVNPQGGKTLYTLRYTLDGKPAELSFYYGPDTGNTIQFKNMVGVTWTKQNDI